MADKSSCAMIPFAAILNSMRPGGEWCSLETSGEFYYDEFGFRIDDSSSSSVDSQDENQFVNIRLHSSPNQSALTSSRVDQQTPGSKARKRRFGEDSKHKLKWMAYLEFTLNSDLGGGGGGGGCGFSWDSVVEVSRCEKVRAMIRGQGVPHSLRAVLWPRLCGAVRKRHAAKFKYGDVLRAFEHDQYHTSKQIEKDLLRTLPTNVCFSSANSVGVKKKRYIYMKCCIHFNYNNLY